MVKIIALSCTQKREPSVTDVVLKSAVDGFLAEIPSADIQTIRLIDHNIRLCEGEDTCLNIGYCPLVDDFNKIAQTGYGADGMILSMPVYGGNVPAILKIFMERLKSTMKQEQRPFSNMSVCSIVHSRTMMTESAIGALGPWYGRLNNRNVMSVGFTQAGHGDITKTKIPDLCFAAGQQLALSFNPVPLTDKPDRPECTFG